MKAKILGLLAVGLLAGPMAANGATTTLHFIFNLGGFEDAIGTASPPISTLSGSFSITFDPAVSVASTTSNLVVNSLDYPGLGSDPAFRYNASNGLLSFGGLQNGANSVLLGTNDFALQVNLTNLYSPTLLTCASNSSSCGKFAGNSDYLASAYARSDTSGGWFATIGSIRRVPEPGTLALLGLGLAGLGLSRRRKAN